MTETSQRLKPDLGYGATPEEALLAVLSRQPAFDTRDVHYIGHRPEFMDVSVGEIHRHEWSNYSSDWDIIGGGGPEDGPFVQIKRPYDIGSRQEKVRIVIRNVWAEVNWSDEERANVAFQFAIELEGDQWSGNSPVAGTLDKTWQCERMSTNPK